MDFFNAGLGTNKVNQISEIGSLILLKEAINYVKPGVQVKKIQPYVKRWMTGDDLQFYGPNGDGEILIGDFAFAGKTYCEVYSESDLIVNLVKGCAPVSLIVYKGSLVLNDPSDVVMFWGYKCQL